MGAAGNEPGTPTTTVAAEMRGTIARVCVRVCE